MDGSNESIGPLRPRKSAITGLLASNNPGQAKEQTTSPSAGGEVPQRPDSVGLGGTCLPTKGEGTGCWYGPVAGSGLPEGSHGEVSPFPDNDPGDASEHRPPGIAGPGNGQIGVGSPPTRPVLGSDHSGRTPAVVCPECGRVLNSRLCCWECCERLCHCGRATGTAFVEYCWLCSAPFASDT